MTWLKVMEYLCHKWLRICSIRCNSSRSCPHSWLITEFVIRLTRWVPLVEHELLTPLEHTSSPPVFSGVCVTRSLVVCVYFVDRCILAIMLSVLCWTLQEMNTFVLLLKREGTTKKREKRIHNFRIESEIYKSFIKQLILQKAWSYTCMQILHGKYVVYMCVCLHRFTTKLCY